MKDPNQTPPALIAGTVLGSLLTLAPLAAVVGTVFGMVRAFRVMGSSGIAEPRLLASEISSVLQWTTVGLALGVLGLPLLITCSVLWVYHRQSVRGQR